MRRNDSYLLDYSKSGLPVFIISVFLLVLLLSQPIELRGQERHLIEGVIFEKETEMPLSGAHVLIEGTSFGTISGPDGMFRLSVTDFPLSLKVTHIGFEDRIFRVEEDNKSETLMLGLVFSSEMLDAVTITDRKAEIVFRDNSYAVLDFEFHENGLMLLIYRNRLKRSELVLLSTVNDTLALLTSLPGKAQKLHRDCQDFTHYLSEDTAYQIHFSGTDLKLIHPMEVNIFNAVATSFMAYHNKSYYFGIRRMNNMLISYIKYDSASATYTTFREIADKKKLQILKDNPWHHMLLANPVSNGGEFSLLQMGSDLTIKDQRLAYKGGRDASIEGHYLRTMVYTPIFAPLFKSDTSILIFNHPESQIEFLSLDGGSEKNVAIDYHEKKNWYELILKDEIADIYYLVFKNANRITLRSIDIHGGEMGQTNILYYPFVKKVLVRNGYAYFTYRQPGSIEKTMLFRQRLKMEQGNFANSDN